MAESDGESVIEKSGDGLRPGLPSEQFPFDSTFDFSFRPPSYWPDIASEEGFLSRIKGTQRRDIARRALQGEQLPRLGDDELYHDAMEFVLEETLDEEQRDRWGSIHPAMLGGEFLPDSNPDEVEIARIELASTTGDVIEIRARPTEDGHIRYRAVDEYWDAGSRIDVSPEVSNEPLTLGELIELIDTDRLCDRDREMAIEHGHTDPDAFVNFVTVSSPFYPTLGSYYRQRAEGWQLELRSGPWRDEVEQRLRELTEQVTLDNSFQADPDELPDDLRERAEQLLVFDILDLGEAICQELGPDADDLRPLIAFKRGDLAEAARLAIEIYGPL